MSARYSSVSIAVALAIQAGALRAQQPGDAGVLQEVVVSATRREQSVLDVPYNITAVSGQNLSDLGVTDAGALVRMVPGLTSFDDGARGSGLRNNFTLRGLNADGANNQDDNPKISQSTVSTYIGETPVYFPLKLVDLERVEVLRGPQGTLYGSSSVGGTIRYIPRKANLTRTTVDASVEGSTTDHAHNPGYEAHITANIPITDTLAFRGTLGHEYVAGFIDALGLVRQTGTAMHPGGVIPENPSDLLHSPPAAAPVRRDSNDARISFGRGNLRWVPNEALELNLNLHYQRNDANDRNEDNRVFGTGQEYVNYTRFTSPQKSELELLDLDVGVDLGFASLSSSSAYSVTRAESVSGGSSGFIETYYSDFYFGYPRLSAPTARTEKHRTFTQEVRLVSQGARKLDWVVGAFYEHSQLDFNLLQTTPGINAYTNAVLGTSGIDFTDILATGGTFQTFEDLAVFGEPTYHITDRWQVTGGVRAFRQKLSGTSGIALPYASRVLQYFTDGVASNDFLYGGLVPTNDTSHDQVFKLNTSYKLDSSTQLFATYAEGFRAGGANQLPATDPQGNDNRALVRYKADTAKNYELGLKGRAFSRFNYGITAFYIDWKDFQTTLVSPFGISYLGNVPGAQSRGLEIESSGSLTNHLAFSLSYAWTKAKVTEAFEVKNADPTTTVAAGTALPGSPEHTLFGALTYTQPLGSSQLAFRWDASYRSRTTSFFRPIDSLLTDNFAVLDAFTVTNASVTWSRDHYGVTLFGKNLGNVRGTSIISTEKLLGPRNQGEGVITPRTLGLRFTWSME
ncbi:MAG: TonB-dependent receptor [Proteobacteria bacterium]|nr:TonB-dependent receptor [Pseudomonadota bacterium]